MTKQLASKILRNVDKTRKSGKSVIFNDRVKGGRSFKVWGWDDADYAAAKEALETEGYMVTIIRTPPSQVYGLPRKNQGNIRLHVSE